LQLAGTFTANANDIFSAAYNFNISLTSAAPVTFTVAGFATPVISGIPFPEQQVFTQTRTIAQTGSGPSQTYTGAAQGGIPIAGGGNFRLTLTFNFSAPAAGDTIGLTIPSNSIDLQVAPTAIPEPSTYALFGVGLIGLAYSARRRLAAKA
ncbi:MAG TPA: PEP-CTERM sorting domain-containing protein, partial [Chthoniobacterales bacterium]